jgi:parallel beta-helix repeat protein
MSLLPLSRTTIRVKNTNGLLSTSPSSPVATVTTTALAPSSSSSGSNDYVSRSALAAAVAGGTVLSPGTVSHAAGVAYRWSPGSTSISDLPGLLPASEVTAHHFGAIADGATNDTAAIQAAINYVSGTGGGRVELMAGTYAVGSTIIMKSKVTLSGADRSAVIRPLNSFGYGYVFLNQNYAVSDYTTRTDYEIGFEGLVFDGSLLPYVMYPTSGYTSQGSMILLIRVDRAFVGNCVFKDYRAGWGIVAQGTKSLLIQDNDFLRMGKEDADTGGILNIANGSKVRNTIVSVSQSNPCVVTFAAPHGFSTGVKYLRGVRGMTQLTDGEYTVTAVTSTTVTLGAVDSSAYSTFVFDAECEMTDRYALRSSGTIITSNKFSEMYRTSVSDTGDGTKVIGNEINSGGETGMYFHYSKNCLIEGNTVRNILLNDISGVGIEINWCVNLLVQGNQIYNTECNGVAVIGMVGGSVSGNVIKEVGRTASLNFPNGPNGTASGEAGLPVYAAKRACVYLASTALWPNRDVDVSENTFIDTRTGAAMLTTYGTIVTKSGSDNQNYNLRFMDNQLSGISTLPEASWHYFVSSTLALGCWLEYLNPITGDWVQREVSGTGFFSTVIDGGYY